MITITDFTDVLIIALAGIWTGIILITQLTYYSRRGMNLPFETEGKILNALTHFILLTSIWISVLQIYDNPNIIWILLGLSLIPFGLGLVINRIQSNYLRAKIRKLRKELQNVK